jgi:hypothetical protein
MILEVEDNGNQTTFINEVTKSRYTIQHKKKGKGEERSLDYYFLYDDYRLFELNGNELEYDFLNSIGLDINDEQDKDIEFFVSKYCHNAFFNYKVILKVFKCFLSDQNKVLLNKDNFIKEVIEEFKIIFDTIKDYNLAHIDYDLKNK